MEPWIDGLWSPLSSLLLGSSSETQSIPKNTGTELKTSLFGIADSALAEQQSLKDRTGTVMFEGDDGGLRTGTVMFEGDDGGNKRIKGRIGRAEMDGGDDVRGTESGPANLSQTISPSAEVAVTPAPSLGAEVEFDGVDGLSDDNDGITSSTAAEVAPSLLSGILQNLDLSDSSLIDPLAKVEGQDDVDMSTDRTVDESCDQALITSLRTRLTGLTGCTLSLPSATHAYLQVLLTEVLVLIQEKLVLNYSYIASVDMCRMWVWTKGWSLSFHLAVSAMVIRKHPSPWQPLWVLVSSPKKVPTRRPWSSNSR